MTAEPTSSNPRAEPELDAHLEQVWQLAAFARALGGEADDSLTELSAAVAAAAGLSVDGVSDQQRMLVLNSIRTTLQQAATLALGRSLPGWNPDDDTLTTQGRASRRVAALILDVIGGQVPELVEQLSAPDARFLDVGVGVAQISIALCQRLPNLRVSGLDINDRPLRLAADNVAADDLTDRIELRKADVADLDEVSVYTLAWLPMPFLSSAVVEPALSAVHRALRPGGWLLAACSGPDSDAPAAAMNRLRAGILGGGHHPAAEVAARVSELGFTDVRQLSPAPGEPPGLVLARKS